MKKLLMLFLSVFFSVAHTSDCLVHFVNEYEALHELKTFVKEEKKSITLVSKQMIHPQVQLALVEALERNISVELFFSGALSPKVEQSFVALVEKGAKVHVIGKRLKNLPGKPPKEHVSLEFALFEQNINDKKIAWKTTCSMKGRKRNYSRGESWLIGELPIIEALSKELTLLKKHVFHTYSK